MLLVNFTWWVNRKDPSGKNLFQGGFLGLDNIGVFDRSAQLPGGGTLEQSDGTAWMAFFSQSMLELALALAEHDPAYEGFVVKFVQHWFQIASAMDPLGDNPDEMWDEEDGFFYDVLRMPDGTGRRIKVRSLVGLLPLCATAVLPAEALARFPRVSEQLRDYYARNADLLGGTADPAVPGVDGSPPARPRRRAQAAPDPGADAGRGPVPGAARHPVGLQVARGPPVHHRRRRSGLHRRVRTGRVAQRHVRRQLQLAWPGVVPDQPAAHPGPAAVPPVLRRRLPDRVPDRLRPRDEPVRGGRGAGSQAGRRRSPATRTDDVRSSAAPSCSRRTRPGGTTCCSTSTSTATTAPGSAPRTRPAGPAWSRASSSSSPSPTAQRGQPALSLAAVRAHPAASSLEGDASTVAGHDGLSYAGWLRRACGERSESMTDTKSAPQGVLDRGAVAAARPSRGRRHRRAQADRARREPPISGRRPRDGPARRQPAPGVLLRHQGPAAQPPRRHRSGPAGPGRRRRLRGEAPARSSRTSCRPSFASCLASAWRSTRCREASSAPVG